MSISMIGIDYKKASVDVRAREFDSCIIRKVLTGRIKPAFFMSNF